MFVLLLLLFACAGAEWVEISQRHYRKPVRSSYNLPAVEKVTEVYFEDSTKAIRIYSNQTLQENVWNRGNVNKVAKHGNVQRVQPHTNPVKAPNGRIDIIKIDHKHLSSGNNDYHLPAIVAPGEIIDLENSFELNLEKSNENTAWIPNKFNKRTEPTNTGNDRAVSEIFKKSEVDKKLQIETTPTSFNINKDDISKIKDLKYLTSYSTSSPDIFTNIKKLHNPEKFKVNQSHTRHSNQEIEIITNEYDTKAEVSTTPIENTKVNKDPTRNDRHPTDNSKSNEYTTQNGIANEKESNKPLKGDTLKTIRNLMQFVKAVADTIQKNTRRSVSSKTRYLQHLKDTILNNIKDRIDSAWPDDEEPSRRRRRAARSARGHVQIPSSESALMTISFLTFAVFLIKLVLQVIQTYKNKTMMMTPTVVATVGRAAAAARKHRGSKPSN